MRIKMQIVNEGVHKNTVVTYVLDRILDANELQNVTQKNFWKVGAAIGRRRLGKLGLHGVPIAITQ